jgi:N-methylhydantoinase A
MANKCIIGVDAGGTFTDFVAVDDTGLRSCKVLSTPDNPALAILDGLRLLGVEDGNCQVIHGTTVGTNAVLEGKGVRVAFITNKGFADLLTIGRQQREQLFALQQPQPPQPVPDELCLEVDARVAADGSVLRELTNEDVDRIVRQAKEQGAEAVAVTLLFSFLYPDMEEQLESAFGADWFVSRSSAVLPVIREYERGIATWLNSYIGPLLSEYLAQLQSRLPNASISVMQSVGTTIEADKAASDAVHMLLSGPAGGLAAAQFLGGQLDCPKILSFDMGGTSTDVALLDGGFELASNGRIGGYPVAVPMVDMHTIGAGGGSIARVDEAGLLLVGPESAGADPGPACYNNGGTAVTVTDAHVVLGRIPRDTLLGGRMPLNEPAARTGLERLGNTMGCDALEAARGVIRVANEHMARALRVISVERGHDPGEYALFSFGGAGGLHVCELADMLEIRKAVVPASSGVLSALGLLVSPPGRVLTQPVLQLLQDADEAAVNGLFEQLAANAGRSLAAEGVASDRIGYRRQAELRYLGQEHALTLDYSRHKALNYNFQQTHEHRYGHRLDQPVELVNLRLLARGMPALRDIQPGPGCEPQTAQRLLMPELGRDVAFLHLATLPANQDITGPAIIADDFATSWVAHGWMARKDMYGHLHIRKE